MAIGMPRETREMTDRLLKGSTIRFEVNFLQKGLLVFAINPQAVKPEDLWR